MESKNQLSFIDKVVKILFLSYIFSVLVFSAYAETNSISKLIFVAFMGVCVLVFFFSRKIRLDPYFWYIGIFILFVFASSLWALKPSFAITKGVTLIQIFALCIFVYSFFYSMDDINFLILSLYISGIAMCVYVVFSTGLTNYIDMLINGARAGDDIGNVNAVGGRAAITAVIGLYYAFFKNKKINYVLMLIPVFVSLGTGSRKALLALIVGGVLLFFIKFQSEITAKNVLKTVFIAVCVIIAFTFILKLEMFSTVNERMQQLINFQTGEGEYDHSAYMRQDMIDVGMEYFKNSPILGIGIGGSAVITKSEYGVEMYLHNNFVELLACGGIVGFTCYYAIFAYILINLIKMTLAKDDSAYLPLSMILTTLVTSVATMTYYDKIVYIYLVYFFLVVKKWKNKKEDLNLKLQ